MESKDESYNKFLNSLPKEKGWISDLYQYQGIWLPSQTLPYVLTCQSHFRALDSDILLVTAPKSGTTWLKALLFALVNRHVHPIVNSHPLTTRNPHDLVPFLELKLYSMHHVTPDLSTFPSPRIFATHLPVGSLPTSVVDSTCKIVFLCRDPRDTFISLWHFSAKLYPNICSFEEAFEKYCNGVNIYGPFWDHILGYWNKSLKQGSRVLFVKYEDVKADPAASLRRLAGFLGHPFEEEEEKDGVVERIVELCSFESLSNLEANKKGKQNVVDNQAFFRRGEVGDWANHLTPEMAHRLEKIIEEKLRGSGLSFY